MDHKTFIAGLARQASIDTDSAEALTSALVGIIGEYAANTDSVAIPGFGRFDSKKHDEYIAIDPLTGRNTLYPPRIEMQFTPGSMLKRRINNE